MTSSQSEPQLKRGSVGLLQIVFFVVAAAAPLTAVVGGSPGAFAFGNGAGVPGAYVLAGALYLLFSVGFTAMSRFVGNTGAFYSYITHGLGRPFGIGGALIALVTYHAIQVAVYGLFGLFVADSLAGLGLNLPWWAYAFLAVGIVHLCGQRNLELSGQLLGLCMVCEILILLVLDIAILLSGGGPEGVTIQSFVPAQVLAPGLGTAMVFVVASYIGFEATAIFAEEAREPALTIPRATYLAVLLITGFYAFSTWAIVQAYGVDNIQGAAQADPAGLFFVVSERLLGAVPTQMMNVLLIVSLFACVLSFHNTINRYFFALGREGLAWHKLARVHPKHASPYIAGFVQSLIALAMLAGFAAGQQDPFAIVFSWMSALATIGILAVQCLVVLAVIVFFRADPRGVGLWHRLIAPGLSGVGLAVCFVLVSINLPLLSGSESPLVLSFPYIIIGVGLLGVVIALWLRARHPGVYARLGRAFQA